MKYFLCVFLIASSLDVFSETGENFGKISKIQFFTNDWGTYNEADSALAVFYMDPALPKACDTGEKRVAIGVNHPLYQSVVSSLLAAKISGTDVKIKYVKACTARSNSWDFGYLLLN